MEPLDNQVQASESTTTSEQAQIDELMRGPDRRDAITGTIVDSNGTPVAGLSVSLVLSPPREVRAEVADGQFLELVTIETVVTSNDGHYVLQAPANLELPHWRNGDGLHEMMVVASGSGMLAIYNLQMVQPAGGEGWAVGGGEAAAAVEEISTSGVEAKVVSPIVQVPLLRPRTEAALQAYVTGSVRGPSRQAEVAPVRFAPDLTLVAYPAGHTDRQSQPDRVSPEGGLDVTTVSPENGYCLDRYPGGAMTSIGFRWYKYPASDETREVMNVTLRDRFATSDDTSVRYEWQTSDKTEMDAMASLGASQGSSNVWIRTGMTKAAEVSSGTNITFGNNAFKNISVPYQWAEWQLQCAVSHQGQSWDWHATTASEWRPEKYAGGNVVQASAEQLFACNENFKAPLSTGETWVSRSGSTTYTHGVDFKFGPVEGSVRSRQTHTGETKLSFIHDPGAPEATLCGSDDVPTGATFVREL